MVVIFLRCCFFCCTVFFIIEGKDWRCPTDLVFVVFFFCASEVVFFYTYMCVVCIQIVLYRHKVIIQYKIFYKKHVIYENTHHTKMSCLCSCDICLTRWTCMCMHVCVHEHVRVHVCLAMCLCVNMCIYANTYYLLLMTLMKYAWKVHRHAYHGSECFSFICAVEDHELQIGGQLTPD